MRICRRTCRIVVLIIGLFQPLVILAQPFGDTELTVFDSQFLAAPPGPSVAGPVEPPLPDWTPWSPESEPLMPLLPDILPLEFFP